MDGIYYTEQTHRHVEDRLMIAKGQRELLREGLRV